MSMRLGRWPQNHSPDHTPHQQGSKTGLQLLKERREQTKPRFRGEVDGP